MHRPQRGLDRQHNDQSFNLPPPAIMDVIANIAACLRAFGGFDPGLFPEIRDKHLRVADIAGPNI